METMRLCPGCMNHSRMVGRPCPVCGFDESKYVKERAARWMPLDTVLENTYRIGRVIGEGGFGITYIGWDQNLQTRVAIKEYFPMSLATRDAGSQQSNAVLSLPGQRQENYRQGLEKFMTEAQNLSRFYNLPGIVSVRKFFFANQTAYMVMEYVDGITLGAYLKQHGGHVAEQEVLTLFRPVMEALKIVHKAGIVHRDISPDNIMMTKDGQMKLIDFGAARFAGGDEQRSLTIILKHGYAPVEQYQSRGNQGPWTDVYAICATMYRMLTGLVPPSAMDRFNQDSLQRFDQLKISVSARTASALLDRGLAIRAADRYQSMDELIEGIYGTSKQKKPHGVGKRPALWQIGAATAGILLLLGGIYTAGRALLSKPAAQQETASFRTDADTRESKKSDKDWIDRKALQNITAQELTQKQQAAIAAGQKFQAFGNHLLTVLADGTVIGKGENRSGECNVENWQDITAVSLGSAHALGLKSDGTVIAAGDTGDGKCAVDIWKNAVSVAAGAEHSLAALADGTAAATGNNTAGQCSVGKWTDIAAVCAGESHSVGLKKDGTAAAAGSNEKGQCEVSDWKDLVKIAANGDATAGLTKDGRVLLAGDTAAYAEALSWEKVADIVLGKDYVAGLLANGQVVTAGAEALFGAQTKDWTDINAIAAGDSALFAQKADGSIIRSSYTCGTVKKEGLSDLTKAVAGDGWILGLKKDGTVVSWGLSGGLSGQCEVADWKNVIDIAANPQASFGLTADGKVLVAGEGFTEVTGWTDVRQISAAPDCFAAVFSDNSVKFAGTKNFNIYDQTALTNVDQISLGRSGTAAILYQDQTAAVLNGRSFGATEETAVVSVTAEEDMTVLAHADGSVSSYGSGAGAGSVFSWQDITQVASGLAHTVGLRADGTVVASGSNENGQCEVSGWTDVQYLAAGDYYTLGITGSGELLIAGRLPGEF